jgi:hypothetical protein
VDGGIVHAPPRGYVAASSGPAAICYPPGMARIPRPSAGSLALAMVLAAACTAKTPAPEKVTPSPAPADTAPAAASDAVAAADETKVVTPPPLTEEDLALLAADPKDLTPEMRRKRAYARRRQIMQNPDSPAARALNDLVEAHQAGDIDVRKSSGTWFSTPGSKPTSGRPPAGWRPGDPQGIKPAASEAPVEGAAEGAAAPADGAQGQP